MSVLVARQVGPEGYAKFLLAFVAWFVIAGVTRATLVQPFTLRASALGGADWRAELIASSRAVTTVALVPALVAIALGFMFQNRLLVIIGIFVPALMLQDFCRFAAFASAKARFAFASDGAWALTQGLGIVLIFSLGHREATSLVLVWGLGGLAGALAGCLQLRIVPRPSWSSLRWFRDASHLAGWFGVAEAALLVSNYAQILILTLLVGRADTGGFQAVSQLFGPLMLVVFASQSIALPTLARRSNEGGVPKVRSAVAVYTVLLSGVALVYVMALNLAGPRAVTGVFGGGFGEYDSLLLPISIGIFVGVLASGAETGLRSLSRARSVAIVQIVAQAVRLAVITGLATFSIHAAVTGLIGANAFLALLSLVTFMKVGSALKAAPEGERLFGPGRDPIAP